MEITFVNPGAEEMLRNIMGFQTEEESVFWSEPLFYFYPQLDKARAAALPFQKERHILNGSFCRFTSRRKKSSTRRY